VIVSVDERYCRTHGTRIADNLVGAFVKARDDYRCRACGRRDPQRVQWAHLISRGARYIRWDPANAVTLCPPCHVGFTRAPSSWSVWLAEHFPGEHDRLSLLEAEGQRSSAGVDTAEVIRTFRSRQVPSSKVRQDPP